MVRGTLQNDTAAPSGKVMTSTSLSLHAVLLYKKNNRQHRTYMSRNSHFCWPPTPTFLPAVQRPALYLRRLDFADPALNIRSPLGLRISRSTLRTPNSKTRSECMRFRFPSRPLLYSISDQQMHTGYGLSSVVTC